VLVLVLVLVLVMQVEGHGGLRLNRDHGVLPAVGVVVPAVNGDRHALRAHLDALQLQVVHNEAGGQNGRRMEPRLNDQRAEGFILSLIGLHGLHGQYVLINVHDFKFIFEIINIT
jgi:hypothetical protein